METQVPTFVLVDPTGRRQLVGHKYRVMKEKLDEKQNQQLTHVFFSQPLSPRPHATLRLAFESVANFTKVFQQYFPKHTLDQFGWDANEGLSVKVGSIAPRDLSSSVDAAEAHQGSEVINKTTAQGFPKVLAGFGPYQKKISQLKEMLDEAQSKGQAIDTIDFNFSNKAILKMSDARMETKNIQ